MTLGILSHNVISMKRKPRIEDRILFQIEAILIKTQMKKSTFGKEACGDPKIIDRLRNGKTIRSDTINALEEYIKFSKDIKNLTHV